MATAATTKTRTPRAKAAPKAEPAEQAEAKADAKLSNYTDEKSGKRLTIQQLKNKLRNDAEREVLNKHKDEVVSITAGYYAEHGLEYVRRLTDEEKAAKEIADRINQYPALAKLFAPAALARLAAEQGHDLAPDDQADDPEPAYGNWAEQQEALRQVAAADGVEFREGE